MNTWRRRLPGVFACLYTLLATGLGSIAFAQAPLNLPPGATTPIVNAATDQSLPSFAQAQFTGLPPGYDVANQTYLGWCTAFNESLLVYQTSPGSPIWSENNAVYRMLNTYPDTGADSTIPPDDQSSAWPMVNWLLNNKGGASGTVAATVVDIQEAIWFLLQGAYVGGSPFTGSFDPNNPTAAAMQLVGDAKANGGSFVPGPGQVVAVLLDGVSQPGNAGPPQDLVFEVNRLADWEMFHHDLSHTGLSQADTSANKGKQKWTFATGNWVRQSSPAVGPDGTIYVGSYDENLYAITPSGKQKWKFATGDKILSSPAVGPDGTIYVGSFDKNLYAVTPDGKQKWKFATGRFIFSSSPAVGGDGTIYIGSGDKNLYAVTPDGKQKWKFATTGEIWSSPAVGGSDGNIYVGSTGGDHNLYAINPDGSQKWKFATRSSVVSSPALGTDGTIYVGSFDKNLYAVNPDGSQKWKFATGARIDSSPAIGADGTIYVGSDDGNLYAVTAKGEKKWNLGIGAPVENSPAIGGIDGTIYIGSGTKSSLIAVQ
jgi:outer membrane protein assembly factor BamB